ncbi:MAG: hypothetical protein ABIO46_07030, partial [Chitinophagales bacterium]
GKIQQVTIPAESGVSCGLQSITTASKKKSGLNLVIYFVSPDCFNTFTILFLLDSVSISGRRA